MISVRGEEMKMTNKIKMMIIKHTKERLKTCDAALANDISDSRLMKHRGECKLILQALENEGDKEGEG